MKKKQLENYLSQIQLFSSPKRSFEQYHTPVQITSDFVSIISQYFDIEDTHVVDLGAGTGMLSIAMLLGGADHITAVEICPDAISTLTQNIQKLEISEECITIVNSDVQTMIKSDHHKVEGVDMVIMNPPFGCSLNQDIDKIFLETAFGLCDGPVFLIHKVARVKSLVSFCEGNDRSLEILKEFDYSVEKKEFDQENFKGFKKKALGQQRKKKEKCSLFVILVI